LKIPLVAQVTPDFMVTRPLVFSAIWHGSLVAPSMTSFYYIM